MTSVMPQVQQTSTASAAEVLFFFEFSDRLLRFKKRKGRLDCAGPFPFRVMRKTYGSITLMEAGLLLLSPVSINQIRVPLVTAMVPEPTLPKPGNGLLVMATVGPPPPPLRALSVKPFTALLN